MKLGVSVLLLLLASSLALQAVIVVADEGGDVEVVDLDAAEDAAEEAAEQAAVPEDKPEFPEETAKTYTAPKALDAFFHEPFSADWQERWFHSTIEKFKDSAWLLTPPEVAPIAFPADTGLMVAEKARHHGLSMKFPKAFAFDDQDLVVQYEVKFQHPLECGGAYLKLLRQEDTTFDPEVFSNETPYTIMFGPDKCGATNKVHFIFNHKNPKTGEFEEKHLKNPPAIRNDRLTHLYTLVVRKDNTYELLIDNESMRSGSLLEDFDPPVNPPKEIDDPTDIKPETWIDDPMMDDPEDKKPDDWDEDAPLMIEDPEAVKPDGWLDDEEELIEDPDAVKPDDWDDEEDGEWVAAQVANPKCEEAPGCGKWTPPMIRNPDYKGKWSPKKIENPEYKGVWKPRQIPNPDYFEDNEPHKLTPVVGLGFELWTMTSHALFDNIYLSNSQDDAKAYADKTWAIKHKVETRKDSHAKAVEAATVASSESGWQAQVQAFLDQVLLFASDNPTYAAGAVVVGLIPVVLLVLCSGGGSSDDGGAKASADDAKAKKDDGDDDAKTDDAADKDGEVVKAGARGARRRGKKE